MHSSLLFKALVQLFVTVCSCVFWRRTKKKKLHLCDAPLAAGSFKGTRTGRFFCGYFHINFRSFFSKKIIKVVANLTE